MLIILISPRRYQPPFFNRGVVFTNVKMPDSATDCLVNDFGCRVFGSFRVGKDRYACHRLLHDHHRQRRHFGHHPRPVDPSG